MARAQEEFRRRQTCPPEAKISEWREWSAETRYLFIERLGMEADKFVALDQARSNHEAEQRDGMLF
jgi:hypothetical protein